jgi:hypothetical protein
MEFVFVFCYQRLPIWEVTTVTKYDIRGLGGGGGALSDQTTKGGRNSIGMMQVG